MYIVAIDRLKIKWSSKSASTLICNCLSYFTTAKISFTSILYPLIFYIHFTSFSSYNRYKLNLHLTCFQWSFINVAQLVEHHTGIPEVMDSNPIGFFLGFICNCLSYFTTAKISFTSILVLFKFRHFLPFNKLKETYSKQV